jgi:hypothetical protein
LTATAIVWWIIVELLALIIALLRVARRVMVDGSSIDRPDRLESSTLTPFGYTQSYSRIVREIQFFVQNRNRNGHTICLCCVDQSFHLDNGDKLQYSAERINFNMTSLSFTTPMTNPYSQKAPSVENLLKNLTRTRGAPTLAMVQSVQEQMMQTQIEWTLEMARDLCSLTMRILNLPDSQNTSISEGCVATLRLLINTMEQWQDNVVYAVLVQDSNSQGDSKHLLDLLILLSKRDHQLHFTALVGLATASRALDRLQQLTSLDSNVPDSAWWFIEEDSEHLAKLSFQILSRYVDRWRNIAVGLRS